MRGATRFDKPQKCTPKNPLFGVHVSLWCQFLGMASTPTAGACAGCAAGAGTAVAGTGKSGTSRSNTLLPPSPTGLGTEKPKYARAKVVPIKTAANTAVVRDKKLAPPE